MNYVDDNDRIVEPSRWDEIAPIIGGFTLRPYEELRQDPDYALPGFYAGENILAFQPGWDGQDGEDAVHWNSRPSVAEVRERITSLLVSSWLVQDRDDANKFLLGDEPGSIASPWGIIPDYVIFARNNNIYNDAPWENLRAVLADADKALTNGAPTHGGFVDWRLRNAVPPHLKVDLHRNPDGAIVAVFRQREADDVITFLWDADGSPRGGEVQEYGRCGLVDACDAYPLRGEADLENVLAYTIG